MVDTIHSVAATVGQDPESSAVGQAKRGQNLAKGNAAKQTPVPALSGQGRDVSEVVKELNSLASQIASTKIIFDVNVETGEAIVKVVNKETGEVIRQVPPKELLRLVSNLQNLTGLIFSERA